MESFTEVVSLTLTPAELRKEDTGSLRSLLTATQHAALTPNKKTMAFPVNSRPGEGTWKTDVGRRFLGLSLLDGTGWAEVGGQLSIRTIVSHQLEHKNKLSSTPHSCEPMLMWRFSCLVFRIN